MSEKIKIFVDAHVFDGVYQGTTTYLRGLYSGLVTDDDFEITLGANDIDGLKKHFTDIRFKFIELPSRSKFRRLAIDIPRIIKINKFDFAHFQYVTPIGRKNCKYINTIHDLLFLEYPSYFPFSYRVVKKILFQRSASNSDILCTVSEYSRNALIEYFKVEKSKIIITPNAIDVCGEYPIDVKKRYGIEKFILFVSRFEPRKNHYLLLKSFVDLKLFEKKYHLVFIGKLNDVKTKEYDSFYQELPENIKKTILSLENVTVNELDSFYKQADLFVYPSLAEGFGIPPLEAAISNCKVLCSNQTAMKDFDFFAQYHFDPHDELDFKAKLIRILEDMNYPYQKIRDQVMRKYSWARSAQVFGNALKSFNG